MASMTPRLNPRPEYPPLSYVLWDLLERQLTIPTSTCVLLFSIGWPVHHYTVQLYQNAGYDDEATFFSIGFAVLKMFTFLLIHGFFFLCEYFQVNEDYRIVRKKSQIASPQLALKSIVQAFIGTFVAQPVIYWLLRDQLIALGLPRYDSPLFGLDLDHPFTYPPATIWHVYKQFAICHLLNEFLMYSTHRILHHPLLYARFHKKHHTWIGIVSHGSEYAHIVENIFSNVLPAVFGPLFLKVHPAMFGTFAFHKLKRSFEHHCGYSFHGTVFERLMLADPKGTAFHDYHHTVNHGNFGAFYLDWFFGTMDQYIASGGFEAYVSNMKQGAFNPSYLHREAMKEEEEKKA